MVGLITDEDEALVRKAVGLLHPNSVVADLGAGQGGTAYTVLSEREDVSLISVDIEEAGLNHARLKADELGSLSRWKSVHMEAVKAAAGYWDEHFHLVLLDTSHGYEETAEEIRCWLPKVQRGGLFWFHDYDAGSADVPPVPQCIFPGVQQAVDEVVAQGLLEVVERQGWSLLTRRPV